MHALTLRPEQDQQFGGFGPGGAEPVRDAGVELGGLARLHDEVVVGEPQSESALAFRELARKLAQKVSIAAASERETPKVEIGAF